MILGNSDRDSNGKLRYLTNPMLLSNFNDDEFTKGEERRRC